MKSARWYLILPMCLVAILVVGGIVVMLCLTLGNQGNDYEPPEAYEDDTLEVVPDTSDAYTETGDTMDAYYNTYNIDNYPSDSDDGVEACDTCANG